MIEPTFWLKRGQIGSPEVAEVSPIEHETVVGAQDGFERLMNEHGMHRSLRTSQILRPLLLGGAHSAQLLQPREIFPSVVGGFSCHLIQDAGDISDHAYGDSAIAADLQRRRVDLDDPGVGRDIGRTAEADGKVLFSAQKYDNVSIANFSGDSI